LGESQTDHQTYLMKLLCKATSLLPAFQPISKAEMAYNLQLSCAVDDKISTDIERRGSSATDELLV